MEFLPFFASVNEIASNTLDRLGDERPPPFDAELVWDVPVCAQPGHLARSGVALSAVRQGFLDVCQLYSSSHVACRMSQDSITCDL
jgi:hypothetical protein